MNEASHNKHTDQFYHLAGKLFSIGDVSRLASPDYLGELVATLEAPLKKRILAPEYIEGDDCLRMNFFFEDSGFIMLQAFPSHRCILFDIECSITTNPWDMVKQFSSLAQLIGAKAKHYSLTIRA